MIHQTMRWNGFPANPEVIMKKKEVSGFQFLFKKKIGDFQVFLQAFLLFSLEHSFHSL